MEEVFNEQEDQIVEQVISAFYYPDQSPIVEKVKQISQAIPALERREEVVEAALTSLAYQQTERRNYITQSLFPDKPLEREKAEILMRGLCKLRTGERTENEIATAIELPNAATNIQNLTPEITQQVDAYCSIAAQRDSYYAVLIAQKKVLPLFNLLKNLPIEQLNDLNQLIEGYISEVEKLGANAYTINPPLPTGLMNALAKSNIAITLTSQMSLGDKMQTLTGIMRVVYAIVVNKQQTNPMADEQLIYTIGLLLFLRGERPDSYTY